MKYRLTILLLISLLINPLGFGETPKELTERLTKLEQENKEIKKQIVQLSRNYDPESGTHRSSHNMDKYLRLNSKYSYEMMDSTTRINRKQQLILEKKKSGELPENSLIVGGAVTAIADYQHSNTTSKFGYLMRHPTSNNQVTKNVSEALVHSAQFSFTGNLGPWVTVYSEILYDPEQSFGPGTNTALSRNQLQMRRAYVLFGNLEKTPYYLSLGKMATPFGLTDTVNPFTASTVWHAFGGLAYGTQIGYMKNGLNVTLMGIQGGAQFRANNTPVDGTNVPSKLNNYAVDVNYTFHFGGGDDSLLLGASYERGSAYNQEFPVTHFAAGKEANPAFDIYSQLKMKNFLVHAEYAQTLDEWPGTFNPDIPQFAAHKVSSWNLGVKYTTTIKNRKVDLSLDFSRFVAGPGGSPWENQDQYVLGASTFLTPSVKVFMEYIHTDGYAPLNFISGGNFDDGSVTHSDNNASSNIFLLGVNAAF